MEPAPRRSKRSNTVLSPARFFNADSPITKSDADIRTFLSICILNWDQYSEDEKHAIISTLPPSYNNTNHNIEGKLVCPMSPDFLANDIVIRDQVARFKRDVADGFYTKTWQEKARKAMKERADGKFDDHLAKQVEELFGDIAETGKDEAIASSDGEYRVNKSKHGASRSKKRNGQTSRVSAKSKIAVDVEGFNMTNELAQ